jgi:non-ribosomal peptide synthetase component F
MTSVMPGAELAPNSNASECALLERVQAWNDTRTNYPRDKTVAQLFEEIAFAHADSIAVIFGAKQLTYAELNVRANRLAHRLRLLGVGHETMVGCCLERSLEPIVAFVGSRRSLRPTRPGLSKRAAGVFAQGYEYASRVDAKIARFDHSG